MNLSYLWDGQSFDIQYVSWQKHLLNANLYMAEGPVQQLLSHLSVCACVWMWLCVDVGIICMTTRSERLRWVRVLRLSAVQVQEHYSLFLGAWGYFLVHLLESFLNELQLPMKMKGRCLQDFESYWQIQWLPRMYLHDAGNIYMMLELHSMKRRLFIQMNIERADLIS